MSVRARLGRHAFAGGAALTGSSLDGLDQIERPHLSEPTFVDEYDRAYAVLAARAVGAISAPTIHRIGKKNPIQNSQ